MGESKRRKQLDITFGLVRKNLRKSDRFPYFVHFESLKEQDDLGLPGLGENLDCYLNKDAKRIHTQLVEGEGKSVGKATNIVINRFGATAFNQRFFQALEKSQGVFLLWLDMVNASNEVRLLTDVQFATEWWNKYWLNAITILGRVNIGDPQLLPWLRRLKGITLFVLEQMTNSFTQSSALKFALAVESQSQFLSMGETTIEIGLAFGAKTIIYAGEAITVYKGTDSAAERGELMIAVKHASGCWTHYPSPNNAKIPLSDYKKAKLALRNFSTSLRGELMHSQSEKLAKLLGLTIRDNYAYLIK
jgi:hypothetical protein